MRWFTSNQAGARSETAPMTEEYAVMPKALRVAVAGLKGRIAVPDRNVIRVSAASAFPVSAAALMAERAQIAAQKQAEAELLKNPQIGKLIPGKGVYMGIWTPKDRDGKSLSKNCIVYAAPQDLTDSSGNKVLLTFQDAAKEVAKLRGWHGHNGGNFENDAALYNALKNSRYNGEWFIPPKELLDGKNLDGNKVYNDNLYDSKDKGDLKGTFHTDTSSPDFPEYYWSSTERRDFAERVWDVRFSDGDGVWVRKDNHRLSCRPCRLELVI